MKQNIFSKLFFLTIIIASSVGIGFNSVYGCTCLFAAESQKDTIFTPDKLPQFSGGDEAMFKFLENNMKYPADAQKYGHEGRAVVRFLVDETGLVSQSQIVRSTGYEDLDKEAIRVVGTLPHWVVDKGAQLKIKIWYNVPICFKLTRDAVPVRKEDIVLFNGNKLPAGFDLNQLERENINFDVVNPKDEGARDQLVKQYGKEAETGILKISTIINDSDYVYLCESLKTLKDTIFEKTDKFPLFKGGNVELSRFVTNNTRYPSLARGITGNVFVRFCVTKSGCITYPKIIKSVSPRIDAEALRVVRLLPNFIPGQNNGKNVNVWVTLPIGFYLKN